MDTNRDDFRHIEEERAWQERRLLMDYTSGVLTWNEYRREMLWVENSARDDHDARRYRNAARF